MTNKIHLEMRRKDDKTRFFHFKFDNMAFMKDFLEKFIMHDVSDEKLELRIWKTEENL